MSLTNKEKINNKKIIKSLSSLCNTSIKYSNDISSIINSKSMDFLINYYKKSNIIRYAPVSAFVYRTYKSDQGTQKIQPFAHIFSEAVYKMYENKKIKKECEQHLLKIADHMELASTQLNTFEEATEQQNEMQNQKEEIKKQGQEIDRQRRNIKKSRKESQKELKNSKNDLDDSRKSFYKNLIAILGIFTAITFATFGGLQLLGNVFGNIKKMTQFSVGSSIVLGSAYLFGIYVILSLLFNGITNLTKQTRNNSDKSVLFAIAFMFFLGIIYATLHISWLSKIRNIF